VKELPITNLQHTYKQTTECLAVKVGVQNINLLRLLYYKDGILQSIDNKKLTAVVLLNMSKAFDSINHNKLLLIDSIEMEGIFKIF